jgi:hypothetical protein
MPTHISEAFSRMFKQSFKISGPYGDRIIDGGGKERKGRSAWVAVRLLLMVRDPGRHLELTLRVVGTSSLPCVEYDREFGRIDGSLLNRLNN